jgi:mRNA-degrading endonuclease toxin of MazEF toxin-antitoxin module
MDAGSDTEREMNRGDIRLVNLGGKAGTRPAVILTRKKVLSTWIVVKKGV